MAKNDYSKTFFSNMLATGAKFIVDDKTNDTAFGPGTTGFISYVKGTDSDYENVFFAVCSIIRRGKTGKTRMDKGELSMPIFDVESIIEKEKIVDNPVIIENIRQIMPNEKRKYYVHIESLSNNRNILEMSQEDYLGWLLAYSMYLKKLSTKAKYLRVWLKDNNIVDAATNIPIYWGEDQKNCIEVFCPEEQRLKMITELRRFELTYRQSALSYLKRISEIEKSAVNFITSEMIIRELDKKYEADLSEFGKMLSSTLAIAEHKIAVLNCTLKN